MIELKGICKDYEVADSKVHALKNVSVTFRPNEFVAVLGPSGGGKTTLLNIVGGLDHYSSGDLIINGKSTVEFKDRDWDSYRNHTVGFVFQSYNLIPHQTVLSNVELALTLSGISKKELLERAKKALEDVGLHDQINKKPNQLSGGQMQRVAIARALVNNPRILLADEPTGALDTQSSILIMDILKKVAKDRLVVMVTHNPELAEQYANRIIRIRDGEIIDDSNPYTSNETNETDDSYGKTTMSFWTAFTLSLNNLMTKKGRTILVSLAGSIGIIGIALIMALSNGVNRYIEDVQRDSLSSYPLTIENSDVDMTSAMMSMMGTVTNTDPKEGEIKEVSIVADIFNQVGANNLKSFKEYLDLNKETIDPLVTTIKYSYGISPHIYSYDTSEKVRKLNPSNLYSNLISSSLASYTFRDAFQEMVDNDELIKNQYRVLAGKWPENYDEMVLVIYNENTISDYIVYSLGIRDPQDLNEYVNKALNGETIEVENEPMTFTLDDFVGMKFKLVLASDYYRYDNVHNIWEDMSSDNEYVKQLVDNGIDLEIVGVVIPQEGVSSTVMTPGVAYRKELIEYIVNESSKKSIVKQQLADKSKDVYTQRKFEDINDDKAVGMDFSNLINIDENKIASAFSGLKNFDPNQTANAMNSYVNQAMNNLTNDISSAVSNMTEVVRLVTIEMFQELIDEGYFNNGKIPSETDMQKVIEKTLEKENIKAEMRKLEQEFGVTEAYSRKLFASIMQSMSKAYESLTSILGSAAMGNLTEDMIEEVVNTLMDNNTIRESIQNIAKSYVENKINTEMSLMSYNMSNALAKSFENISIDTKALEEAFEFNMNEDELKRYMMSFMNSGNRERSAEGNLRDLGYCSFADPNSISLYFVDFESKEMFKDFLEDYNNKMESSDQHENVIVYTDITGIMISSVTQIIDAISYVLIAFVSVSLVVSSIMIGIITYISVLERTKEIGILRSLGASKANVANVFNAETFIIGLSAGTLGVVITMLLCYPINWIVRSATGIPTLTAYLPIQTGLILIVISVILTIIAGLIPARMATKCDPVTALRSE